MYSLITYVLNFYFILQNMSETPHRSNRTPKRKVTELPGEPQPKESEITVSTPPVTNSPGESSSEAAKQAEKKKRTEDKTVEEEDDEEKEKEELAKDDPKGKKRQQMEDQTKKQQKKEKACKYRKVHWSGPSHRTQALI